MGYRISKVYTRTGDRGETALGDGNRVRKDHPRICAIGDVDELNCLIGLLLSHPLPKPARSCLTRIQHELFDLGGELSIPKHQIISPAHVARLEQELDAFNTELPHLKEFVLPGGSRAASTAHVARAVCRRAERQLVTLARKDKDHSVSMLALSYLNRLSDLLFVLARLITRHDGKREVMWNSPRGKR